MSRYSGRQGHIASNLEDLATDVLKGSYEATVLYSMIRNVAYDTDEVALESKRQDLLGTSSGDGQAQRAHVSRLLLPCFAESG
jgi:hypothetical protein